jgi:dTDP-4-dehydrorhamnose 3,5-epimerase
LAVPTTEFTPHETQIPGLLWFDVTKIGDERGYFQEKYHEAKLQAAGVPKDFIVVQTNVSYNKEVGVTRGFHAEPWDKFITLVAGRAFVAFVDLREGAGYRKVVTLELTPEKAVFLPEGVGNSYQTVEENTFYLYSVSAHWSAELYDHYLFVNLGDPDIGVQWPVPLNQAIMSERDKNHPMLKDVKHYEK